MEQWPLQVQAGMVIRAPKPRLVRPTKMRAASLSPFAPALAAAACCKARVARPAKRRQTPDVSHVSALGKLGRRPSKQAVQGVLEAPGWDTVPVKNIMSFLEKGRLKDVLSKVIEVLLAAPSRRLDARDFTVALSVCSMLQAWQDACLLLASMPGAKVGVFKQIVCFKGKPASNRFHVAVPCSPLTGEGKCDQLQQSHQCLRERRSVAAGVGFVHGDARSKGAAGCHQLQCDDQRLRERQAVEAGIGHVWFHDWDQDAS